MLNKNVKLLLTLSGIVLFCGCSNLKHVCTPETCTPICIKYIEQFDKNAEEERAKWNEFKNMVPYTPHVTGINLLDKSNIILARISAQIKNEIVVPYRELAEQGHIEAYKAFRADVNLAMSLYRLDCTQAVAKVYAYWNKKYGTEKCQQLWNVFPYIERMRTDRQLAAVFMNNKKELIQLISQIRKDIDQLKAAAKDFRGILDITTAGTETLIITAQLTTSLNYLGEFCKAESQMETELKTALQEIQRYNQN